MFNAMRKLSAKHAGTAGGHRAIIVALCCVAALIAVGCSAVRLSYGQAPRLSYWWADKYFDFDDEQAPQVRAALAQWFAWHRASQLPDYARQLARAQAELQQPFGAEQACRWYAQLQARADTAFAQALPAMARLSLELRPEQVHHMARRFDKLNAEYRDDLLDEPPAAQHKILAKKLRERYESLYGTLERPQRAALDAAVAASPISAAQWDAERRLRQQDTLATLRQLVAEHPPVELAQARLQALYERAKHSPRPAYLAAQQQLVQAHCALFAQVHALASSGQRDEVVAKLRGWEEDALSLAGGAEKPVSSAAPAAGGGLEMAFAASFPGLPDGVVD